MTIMINPTKYPLRTCMYMNECRICNKRISAGDKYYDGGYSRRFHKECADNCNVEDNKNEK